jgi:uncharacterized membrane protein
MESLKKAIEVSAPVADVYEHWTRFESFPDFMEGITEVKQLDEKHLHWVMEIAGSKKEWDTEITEHIRDQRISWRSISGAPNSGTVSFLAKDANHTLLTLQMKYQPEGPAEQAASALGLVSRRIEKDLKRFRDFIEKRLENSRVDSASSAEPALERGYGTSGKSGLS